MAIFIQKELFNIEKIISNLRADKSSIGAVVSFVGYVREFDKKIAIKKLKQMDIEHYPGMTEKALMKIE